MVENGTHLLSGHKLNPLRKLLSGRSRKKESSASKNNNNNNNNKNSNISNNSLNNSDKGSNYINARKDAKVNLFSFPESEISQYKLDFDVSDLYVILQKHKPSVITQGKFQIYTINTVFNYFTSGSLTRPILPSSKFIKITANTYIIPIRHRRRYWKLSLNTEDTEVIEEFERILASIAKLTTDMILDFPLQSPFTSFINTANTTNTSNVSTTSNIVNETIPTPSSHSVTLYHPVPVRPQTSSTVSINSNSLLNMNADISSLNTTYSDVDKVEEDNDIDYDLHDISSSELLTLENMQDPDTDLDEDLLKSEEYLDLEFEDTFDDKGNIQLDQSTDDLVRYWDEGSLTINENISKRYSLSFKNFDSQKPISADAMKKYKDTLTKLVMESKSSTGLFDK